MAKVQAQGKTFTCQPAAKLRQVLLANGDVLCALDVFALLNVLWARYISHCAEHINRTSHRPLQW